jgi:hypothetical protein
MSSAGIQNYLSNVFRQVYRYDATASPTFTPRLELSNIDTYSGNTISVFTAAVGDSASNVYVGSNAGNPYNIIQSCRNVTAVGYGAGSNIFNVSNSVYMGFYAGAQTSNASAVIAVGANAIGGGISNIAIGNGTGTVGTSNILIGHGIAPVNASNQIRIGMGSNILIAGNLASNWVGLGGILSPVDANNKFDVSGNTRIQGDLGIRTTPGSRTLDVSGSFRANSGTTSLDLSTTALSAIVGSSSLTLSGTSLTSIIGSSSLSLNNFFNVTDASGGELRLSNTVTSSTGGYTSVRATVLGGATPLVIAATLTIGIILVSAIDVADSVNRSAAVFFAYTTSNAVALSQHDNGDLGIAVFGGQLLVPWVGGGSKTIKYSITNFPLP